MTFVLHFITPKDSLVQPSEERSASQDSGEEYKDYVKRSRLSLRARSTLLNSSLVITPRRRMRRDFSMVISCSHLTSVKSVRPFSSEGAIRICKGISRSVRL